MAPSQDASDHQDDTTCLIGNPYEPSFTTGILGGGHTQSICSFWIPQTSSFGRKFLHSSLKPFTIPGGDVIVFGGSARDLVHAMLRVFPDTGPTATWPSDLTGGKGFIKGEVMIERWAIFCIPYRFENFILFLEKSYIYSIL